MKVLLWDGNITKNDPQIEYDSQNSNVFFFIIGKVNSHIHMKLQGASNSQNNIEKEKQNCRTHNSQFQTIVIQTVCYWHTIDT